MSQSDRVARFPELASDLAAGVRPGNGYFGDADDSLIPGGGAIVSRIASITIKGQALGSTAAGDSFGFAAQQIGALKVGGIAFKLTPGASNDLTPLPLGATADLRAREL